MKQPNRRKLEEAQPRGKISLLLLKNGSMAAINSSTEPLLATVRFVPLPSCLPMYGKS